MGNNSFFERFGPEGDISTEQLIAESAMTRADDARRWT
jgi:hypothetical protein